MPGAHSRCALWRRILDDGSDEFCTVGAQAGQAQIDGVLVGFTAEIEPFTCSYRISAARDLTGSNHLSVRYKSANASRSLSMSRVDGGWEFGTQQIEADEIDLEWSPVTNMFPIRRMLEREMTSLELSAAWVRAPDLRVEKSVQRYDRIDDLTARYTNLESGFTALIKHDGEGFPLDYEGVWKQRSYWSNES